MLGNFAHLGKGCKRDSSYTTGSLTQNRKSVETLSTQMVIKEGDPGIFGCLDSDAVHQALALNGAPVPVSE